MQAVSKVRVREWGRSRWVGLALSVGLLSVVGVARATSDAGPANGACSDGGRGEWIACELDADCPGGQSCHEHGVCVCETPEIPETHSSEGCSVAPGGGPAGPSLLGLALLGLAVRRAATRARS